MSACTSPFATRPSPTDFDFIIGSWEVRHRRLRDRLAGCKAWDEFAGQSTTRKILGGDGNLEDCHLALLQGSYRAVALRSFDAHTGRWSIWWLDGRAPERLDVPVVGRFVHGVGSFFADDQCNGQPVRVRFLWTQDGGVPRWEQAFSADAGLTWETNWTMEFRRAGTA